MLSFIFDTVGFGEWFMLLAVVLIVVGPKKLPSAARTLGSYYARFRRAAENFKRQIMDMETEISKEAQDVENAFVSSDPGAAALPAIDINDSGMKRIAPVDPSGDPVEDDPAVQDPSGSDAPVASGPAAEPQPDARSASVGRRLPDEGNADY